MQRQQQQVQLPGQRLKPAHRPPDLFHAGQEDQDIAGVSKVRFVPAPGTPGEG